jgi:hypothetical protein
MQHVVVAVLCLVIFDYRCWLICERGARGDRVVVVVGRVMFSEATLKLY